VQARLAEQVAELRARDPLVRRDVPDAVHKMRVAIRRLRGALATFRPFLDREVTDPLRDELRLLGLALSDARDVEVVHERIADLLTAERADLVRGPVLRQVNADLARRYRAAHAHAVGVMESEGYFELLAALDRLAADPPFTKGARRRVADVLPGRVRHDWKRLAERVGAVGGAADPAERDRRLHGVRKAAKRLRYAAEPLVQLYGADAEALVAAAKSIQKVLGDHQDGVLVQAILLQLADESTAAGHDDFTFGLLYAREQMAAERSLAEFEDTWRAASRKRLRRWLG
jgi:CHAD domain-containing protein